MQTQKLLNMYVIIQLNAEIATFINTINQQGPTSQIIGKGCFSANFHWAPAAQSSINLRGGMRAMPPPHLLAFLGILAGKPEA